jgi:hypothetical protein
LLVGTQIRRDPRLSALVGRLSLEQPNDARPERARNSRTPSTEKASVGDPARRSLGAFLALLLKVRASRAFGQHPVHSNRRRHHCYDAPSGGQPSPSDIGRWRRTSCDHRDRADSRLPGDVRGPCSSAERFHRRSVPAPRVDGHQAVVAHQRVVPLCARAHGYRHRRNLAGVHTSPRGLSVPKTSSRSPNLDFDAGIGRASGGDPLFALPSVLSHPPADPTHLPRQR